MESHLGVLCGIAGAGWILFHPETGLGVLGTLGVLRYLAASRPASDTRILVSVIGAAGLALSLIAPGLGLGLLGGTLLFSLGVGRDQEPQEPAPGLPAAASGPGVVLVPILHVPILEDPVLHDPVLQDPVPQDWDPLHARVPLARLLAPASEVRVVWIEAAPSQAPQGISLERNAWVRSKFANASQGLTPRPTFEQVSALRPEEVLRARAADPAANWVVMSWRSPSPWRSLLCPLARFMSAPPANLALYRPLPGEAEDAPFAPKRVMVLASRGPQDEALFEVAARIASCSGACTVTAVYLAAQDATPRTLLGIYDYHAGISSDGCAFEVEVVRASRHLEGILEAASRHDLLVLGSPGAPSSWLRPQLEDEVARAATCGVLQLKAGSGSGSSFDVSAQRGSPRLSEVLDFVEVVPDARFASKQELIAEVSRRFSEELGGRISSGSLRRALWERELEESTRLANGVAAPRRSSFESLDRVHLGLWILNTPLDFDSSEGEQVDLCFVLLGPPSLRSLQFQLLEQLRELAARPAGLLGLRSARDLAQARAAIRMGEDATVLSGQI